MNNKINYKSREYIAWYKNWFKKASNKSKKEIDKLEDNVLELLDEVSDSEKNKLELIKNKDRDIFFISIILLSIIWLLIIL